MSKKGIIGIIIVVILVVIVAVAYFVLNNNNSSNNLEEQNQTINNNEETNVTETNTNQAENTAEVQWISFAIWLGFYLFILILEYGVRFLIAILNR